MEVRKDHQASFIFYFFFLSDFVSFSGFRMLSNNYSTVWLDHCFFFFAFK